MFDLHALITKAESQFANLRGEKIKIYADGELMEPYAVILDNPALLTDAGDVSISTETIAVQLTASDLVCSRGRRLMPHEGWSITRYVEGFELKYKVFSPGTPNQHFVWLGTTRQRLQVYAILMGRERSR